MSCAESCVGVGFTKNRLDLIIHRRQKQQSSSSSWRQALDWMDDVVPSEVCA